MDGYSSVAVLRSDVTRRLLEKRKALEATQDVATRASLEAQILQYEDALEKLPKVAGSMNIAPSELPTEAVMGGVYKQFHHPYTRAIGAAFDRVDRPKTLRRLR